MAIKLEMDGATFTFETTEEYEAFTKLHNEAGEVEVQKEDEIKVGDKVEIIGNTDDYHSFEIGLIGEVLGFDGVDYLVEVDDLEQYVPKQDVKKVEAVAKEKPKKETFYMIKSEYVDTDIAEDKEFAKGADEVLIGNKREADGLVALISDYEFIGDVIERFDDEGREGKVAFNDEQVYEVTREEYEAKKAAYLADKDANKDVPEGYEKVSFADAKEGDFYLALEDEVDIDAGKKYEISEDSFGDLGFNDNEDDFTELYCFDEDEDGIVIRKIAEEDAQKEPQKDSFKVGDKVRIIGNDNRHAFDIGEVVTVIGGVQEWTKDKQFHDCENEDGVRSYVRTYDAELVVEGVQKEAVDEGLTIKGGVEVTNVNKIEEGDVVRTTTKYTDFLGDSIKDGRLAIVLEVRPDGVITVKQRSDKDYVIINAEDVESTLELVAKAIK